MATKFCTPGCYAGKILFAVKNEVSKIIRNWFLTLQPDIFLNYLQFTNVSKIKGMDVI